MSPPTVRYLSVQRGSGEQAWPSDLLMVDQQLPILLEIKDQR